MASRVDVRVHISREKIARLNAPGGMVKFYVQRIGNEVVAESSRRAPRSRYYPSGLFDGNGNPRIPGRLKSSLRRTDGGFSPDGSTIYVIADSTIAPHAIFVIRGTTGPITARSGGLLKVPAGSSRGVLMRPPRFHSVYVGGGRYVKGSTPRNASRDTPRYSQFRYPKSVKGQEANPFMQEALHAVMLRRGLL